MQVPNDKNWQDLKTLALKKIASPLTHRAYSAALDDFARWHESTPKPRVPFLSKQSVERFRGALLKRGLRGSGVNIKLTAIRRLARRAAAMGWLSHEIASGICGVKNVKDIKSSNGVWLSKFQAETLINMPDGSTRTGKRDRVLISLLLGCGLRRGQAISLTFKQIQQREGRWCIVGLNTRGTRTHEVPMPAFAKCAIDEWAEAAKISRGAVLRPVNRWDRLVAKSISNSHTVWLRIKNYCNSLGVPGLKPSDLRRTYAKLSSKGGAPLKQIQFSLGHANIATTERYIETAQDFQDAPCDRLGLKVAPATQSVAIDSPSTIKVPPVRQSVRNYIRIARSESTRIRP